MDTDSPTLTRPPFSVVGSLAPPQVGAEMVACFDRLGARADRLEHAYALVSSSIGVPETDTLLNAGRAIARDIDRGIGAGVSAGYHNAQHFLEVMLSACYLARLAPFDSRRTLRVVTAALMHDFHHDGSRSVASPFRLELVAMREARPYLRSAGVAEDECGRLQALVLATEPRAGVPFARACCVGGTSAGHGLPLPSLSPLLAEQELAQEAVLLAEADVLPSVGLTFEHAERLQARLALEWGAVLGRDDKLQFMERVAGDFSVAAFFVPNIRAMQQIYRDSPAGA